MVCVFSMSGIWFRGRGRGKAVGVSDGYTWGHEEGEGEDVRKADRSVKLAVLDYCLDWGYVKKDKRRRSGKRMIRNGKERKEKRINQVGLGAYPAAL